MEQYLERLLPKGTKMVIRMNGCPDRQVISTGKFTYISGYGCITAWAISYQDPSTKMTGATLAEYIYCEAKK